MGKPSIDTSEWETFEVTIPVIINLDPNRKENSLLMRVIDCEVEVTDSESGKVLGAAGGAFSGRLFAQVGRYTASAMASDFWKAVRAKLEELKSDLWESDDGDQTTVPPPFPQSETKVPVGGGGN